MWRFAIAIVVLSSIAKFVRYEAPSLRTGLTEEGIDFRYLYAAGNAWRSGLDPYRLDDYRQASALPLNASFAYAPTIAPLAIALSLLPRETAVQLLWLLNVIAAIVVAAFLVHAINQSFQRRSDDDARRLVVVLAIGIVVLSAFSLANVRSSQTSLLALSFLCAAWWATDAGSPWLAGTLAALATFKPSISVLVLLVLVIKADRRTLAAFAIAALLLASAPLIRSGPFNLIHNWIAAMQLYTQFPQNKPGYEWSFGVRTLLTTLRVGSAWIPMIAIAGFAWSVVRHRYVTSIEMFALCLAWPVLFIQAHYYDLVVLLPLFVAGLIALRSSLPALALCSAAIAVISDDTGIVNRWLVPASVAFPNGALFVCAAFVAGIIVLVERRVGADSGAGGATMISGLRSLRESGWFSDAVPAYGGSDA